jgi:uncharacterized membrane protein
MTMESLVLEFLSRSSWGVIPLQPIIGLTVLALAGVLAWLLLHASSRPGAWRGDRGQGLVEVLLAVLLIIVILVVIFAVLPVHR